ncbi:hypothetical protein [Caulobacter sp. BP25]
MASIGSLAPRWRGSF